MSRHLHIVTHEVPWPADFGGVIDLFYKIKALHSFGIKIHLHCYTAGKEQQPTLEKYCESVKYYRRKKGLPGLSFRQPYIVQSRSDAALLTNLNADHHPILLEGIHCTYFLQSGQLANRKVFVRLHNVEYKYYLQLAKHETNIFRKAYYNIESRLLKAYEKRLAKMATFWAVSQQDEHTYKTELQAGNVHFLPVFIPWQEISTAAGTGTYCLYHGNLSINENEKVVEWLLNKVFAGLNIPVVIAGKDPTSAIRSLARSNAQVKLIENPSEVDMEKLIKNAQINILPSFNNTGIKLKLLNALYNGRHCLLNKAAVEGSGLEAYCNMAETATEFREAIKVLREKDFTEELILQREAGLKNIYDMEKNAQKLIAWIY